MGQGTVEERSHPVQARKSQSTDSLLSDTARDSGIPLQGSTGKYPERR